MKLFSYNNKSFFLSLALVFASISLIANKESQVIDSIQAKLLDNLSPVIEIFQNTADSLANLSNNVKGFIFTYHENKVIKARNEILENYFYLYKQLEAENLQLKTRLKFTNELKHGFISAKVIARNNNSFNQKIIVNAGAANKVKKWQMALVNNQLIGRVVDVSEYTATILLLTDHTSRIPVVSLETQTKFLAIGDGTKYLLCSYLGELHQLKEGELVTTNNDNEAIVPDIIVGSVFKDEQNFYLKPIIDYDKIDFVQIIIP